MFKKTVALVSVAVAMSSLTGCYANLAFEPNQAPIGALVASSTTADGVADTPLTPKKGEACAASIFGLITFGDASAKIAAADGGITKITSVDSKNLNVLGIYSSHCTEIQGD